MELAQLNDAVWIVRGAVNMALIGTADGLVAVDTGLDKQAAKTLEKAAAQIGRPLCAIVNTHAHADHFGGNAHLLSHMSIPVYAPEGEAAVIRRPQFEPEYLWQGAQPLPALHNKFLLAAPSRVDVEIQPGSEFTISDTAFLPLGLPGHAMSQCGLLVNGVCFAADAYFDPGVVDKHGIPFLVNYPETLASAERVLEVAADWFVPGHGEPTADAALSVRYFTDRVQRVFHEVLRQCETPRTLDEIMVGVCRTLDLSPANPGAFVLLRTPIAACLSAAVEEGRVQVAVDSAKLQFQTVVAQ